MKKAKTNLGANTGLNKKFVKVKTARRRSNASTRWLRITSYNVCYTKLLRVKNSNFLN